MADFKGTRIEYHISLTQDEFSLVSRSLGRTAGAKVSIRGEEIQAIRELNLKLAHIRASTVAVQKERADTALANAEKVMAMPLPQEEDV